MPTRNTTAPVAAPSVSRSIADLPLALVRAIDEQQLRVWRLAALLRSLRAPDDDGVSPHVVVLAAEIAEQIAGALDSVRLPKRAAEIEAEAVLQ